MGIFKQAACLKMPILSFTKRKAPESLRTSGALRESFSTLLSSSETRIDSGSTGEGGGDVDHLLGDGDRPSSRAWDVTAVEFGDLFFSPGDFRAEIPACSDYCLPLNPAASRLTSSDHCLTTGLANEPAAPLPHKSSKSVGVCYRLLEILLGVGSHRCGRRLALTTRLQACAPLVVLVPV